jgi:hypothetical protein
MTLYRKKYVCRRLPLRIKRPSVYGNWNTAWPKSRMAKKPQNTLGDNDFILLDAGRRTRVKGAQMQIKIVQRVSNGIKAA